MNRVILLFVLVAIATSAYAGKPWSFAGIRLGVPLAASNLPSCPMPADSAALQGWTPPKAICVSDLGSKSPTGVQLVDLDGLTALHWHELYRGYAAVWDGRVGIVHVQIGHSAYDSVKQILLARYGKPKSITHSTVTSNGGASVDSEKVIWNEHGNTISIAERCDRIDRSCVDVSNDALIDLRAKEEKNAAADDASIL